MNLLSLKLVFAGWLTGSFMSSIFSFFNKRIYSLSVRRWIRVNSEVHPSIRASIFFGLYESCELRFVRKYLSNGEAVIELGASLGFISGYISEYKLPKILIGVEAHPKLMELCQFNSNATIINAIALDSMSDKRAYFMPNKFSTGGGIGFVDIPGSMKIGTVTVNQILLKYGIVGDFVLISDIEGSEYLVLPEVLASGRCKLLIIETHTVTLNGNAYNTEYALDLLSKFDYVVVEQYGPNIVAARKQ